MQPRTEPSWSHLGARGFHYYNWEEDVIPPANSELASWSSSPQTDTRLTQLTRSRGPSWDQVGTKLGRGKLGPSWGGESWSQLGPNLGPSWDQVGTGKAGTELGPSWDGESWDQVGTGKVGTSVDILVWD